MSDAAGKALYDEKTKRIEDSIALRRPDRIPTAFMATFWMAKYGGISHRQLMYDYDAGEDVARRVILDLDPDMYMLPHLNTFIGPTMEKLGFKQLQWPGCGLASNLSHQFVEGEYMMADEYDRYMLDPTDYNLRVMLPRTTPLFESFRKLPPFSNIFGNTQPLLRYRTRDISRLSLDEVCPACGFSGAMLEGSIVGRVDDMIWYHGVNVFPTAIEETLGQFDELTAEYQILIDGGESTARMTIRCESSVDINGGAAEELGKRVTEGIKRAIRVNACVELLAAGTLPRSTGRSKLRRVVDKRRDAES